MALFIGGPLDGRLVDVDDSRTTVEVAIDHRLSNSVMRKPNKLTDIFFYKRETLDCPTANISVFVPRNYSCEDVILSLIEGYHQNAQHDEDGSD